jgi:hypothetical protein
LQQEVIRARPRSLVARVISCDKGDGEHLHTGT